MAKPKTSNIQSPTKKVQEYARENRPGFLLPKSRRNKNIMCIYRCCVFSVFALVVAVSGGAQSLAKRLSPMRSAEASDQSQADLDTISLDNTLAERSGDNSTASFRSAVRVQGGGGDALRSSAINRLIVDMTNRMPAGGEYRASSESIQKLESAIKKEGNHLAIEAAVAKPSFCSSATYLVFVSTLEELDRRRRIQFEEGVAEKLLVTGQHDGFGVWGRWNANGPGTARLFAELYLGHNFTSIEKAQPGDFLKIFWNDQIGVKEFGHSVVYLGHGLNSEGIEVVQYWSSNKKGGYGRAEVPRSKIKRMLFSRLDYPERINEIRNGLKPDAYLASMLVRSSTPEEMKKMVGIPASATADPF